MIFEQIFTMRESTILLNVHVFWQVSAVATHGKVSSCTLAAISRVKDEGIIEATVAGMPCKFIIDSGAQVNTLTENIFRLLLADPKYSEGVFNVQEKSDRALKAYASAGEIEVLATFEAYLFISKERPIYLEKFYVVRELRSLLSRSTATRYSVLLLGIKVPVTINDDYTVSFLTGEIASVNAQEIFPKFNILQQRSSTMQKCVPQHTTGSETAGRRTSPATGEREHH